MSSLFSRLKFPELRASWGGMHILEMLAKSSFIPPSSWGKWLRLPQYVGAYDSKFTSIRPFFELLAMLAKAFFATGGGHLTKLCYNTPRACS